MADEAGFEAGLGPSDQAKHYSEAEAYLEAAETHFLAEADYIKSDPRKAQRNRDIAWESLGMALVHGLLAGGLG